MAAKDKYISVGTLLGAPIVRTIVFWGLYWGPLILGNYHIVGTTERRVHEAVFHLKQGQHILKSEIGAATVCG